MVQLLLQKGADVHAQDDEALLSAADFGHDRIVQMLLTAGADIHADNDDALRSAVCNSHHSVVQMLLKAGADVHAYNYTTLQSAAADCSDLSMVRLLIHAVADIHKALRSAAQYSHRNAVQTLIEAGANGVLIRAVHCALQHTVATAV